MMRPVILSSPAKTAVALTIFCVGGCTSTSSLGGAVLPGCGGALPGCGGALPGCGGALPGGVARGCRWPGGSPATGGWLGAGGAVPGGGGSGCDCTPGGS